MGYYRRPYYLTMLGKPYLSLLPYSSTYKREYGFHYPRSTRDWYLDSWPRPSDDYLYWIRPGAIRYPRYFPVYEWCPSHSYKYQREVKNNILHDPIYTRYSFPGHYYYDDYDYIKPCSKTTTIVRSEPYGGFSSYGY